MDAASEIEPTGGRTSMERASERELVVKRAFNGPARVVFEAWTRPELMKRWWVPKSTGMTLASCEMDVRVGGRYRFEFMTSEGLGPVAFFGKYTEVVPYTRLAWTNEESEEGSVTTVTFEETGGRTLLVLREVYPSREALEGMENGLPEQFEQLDELLAALDAGQS